MKKLLQTNYQIPVGLDIIRVITGCIIISFGFEIFNSETMAGYQQWLGEVGVPFPKLMAKVGKLAELICGFGLTIGLFTRFCAIPLMLTMVVVNFIMLDGNLRSEPFYLLLLFTIFLFSGSGKISIDSRFLSKHEK